MAGYNTHNQPHMTNEDLLNSQVVEELELDLQTPVDGIVSEVPLTDDLQFDLRLDVTKIYLSEIGTSPLLSAKEETHYARLARQGCFKSKKRMIESNLRLVVRIARRYLNR